MRLDRLRHFLAGTSAEFVEIATTDLLKLVDVAEQGLKTPAPRAPAIALEVGARV